MAHVAKEGRDERVERTADLLGGRDVFKRRLSTPLDAHEALSSGLPGKALVHLSENVEIIRHAEVFEKALGLSFRTFQRHKKGAEPRKLSQEQAGRAWKFAEIFDLAVSVLGSPQEAERFLERPAIGLDQNCPLDLLGTPAGVKLVETYLERVKHGVYV